MMDEHGKSDSPIVPEKSSNKAKGAAEAMEGRGLAKGNPQSVTRPGRRAGSAGQSRLSGYARRLVRLGVITRGKSPVR